MTDSWARTTSRKTRSRIAALRQVAILERGHTEELRRSVGADAVVAFVPYLAHDVYDFAALAEIGRLLFAPDTVPV